MIALLSLVMLAAALNLLGVFEVGLSAQRVGALDIGRGAFVRSAMTGALAIVVATRARRRLWPVRLAMR